MFVLPTSQELIGDNKQIPEAMRQRAVLLKFKTPVTCALLNNFHRIHLTADMLAAGEDEFFQADVFQPHRTATPVCPNCGQFMAMIQPTLSRCTNARCRTADGTPTSAFDYVTGPIRGVVKVLTFPDHVVEVQHKQTADGQSYKVEWVNACVLVLDRRYRDEVLAAVYRTAGMLCDELGWGLA